MKIIIITFDKNENGLSEKIITWLLKQEKNCEIITSISNPDFTINPFSRTIIDKNGELIYLTAKEFDLLYFLVSHKGQVFSKEQLYNNVWGYDYPADANNLTSFIRKLRKKIEPDPDNPRYIITIRGAGYKFTEKEKP